MSTDLPIQMLALRRGHKRKTMNRIGKKAGDRKSTAVRLDLATVEALDAHASANCRSRNSEIVLRLQESLEGQSIDEHGVIVVRSAQSLK